jgi:hypothetical protein
VSRGYHRAVKAFSVVMIAIGVAVLVATFAAGGGPASVGFLMGLAFIGIGIGRYWVARRMER